MPALDYSKWDKLEVSDDEECAISIDENEDGAIIKASPGGANKSNIGSPNVTRFEKPTTVTVAPYKNDLHINQPSKAVDSAKETDKVHYRILPKSGCATDWFAWDQTRDSVECHFRLPQQAKLSVDLDRSNPTDFPGSLTAGDVMSGETGFPSAFGLLITIRVSQSGEFSIPDSFKSVWSSCEVAPTEVRVSARFPFPVVDAEEAWLWNIESRSKWFTDSGSYLVVSVKKKTSPALMGLSIWWDKLFTHHDPVIIERPQSASTSAFQSVWQDAHKKFRERMKDRQPIDLSGFDSSS